MRGGLLICVLVVCFALLGVYGDVLRFDFRWLPVVVLGRWVVCLKFWTLMSFGCCVGVGGIVLGGWVLDLVVREGHFLGLRGVEI